MVVNKMLDKCKFKILPLLIIFLLLLTSCFSGESKSGTPVSNSNSLVTTGQNIETAKAVSRYAEIFDPSEDAGKLVIRFLYTITGTDTKAGDSTIIKTPDGKVILVDGSAPETAQELTKYLDDLGIRKIDAVIASHPHIDHVGGLAKVINHYQIGRVYRSAVEYTTNTNKAFLKAVDDKKIETVILKDGMDFEFGEIKFNVFNPVEPIKYPASFPDDSTSFLNDNSVVLKMTYKSSTILLTGDIYTAGEKNILNRHQNELQADILKMPHHGDDTSSSSAFIKAVQPKIAVAMSDEIASMSVYNSYRKSGSKAYITAVDGCVKVVANGTKEYTVVTEKDRADNTLK